ncbi:aminotransferase class I/II-fold pyridoxal phosphate-dependent enzyme [Flavobacterium sp.]|uniref:pyridoxal phosphate-dependent decarboxylase family protein n=1 Tax=Flavobacterium sp. TaxID=239 RepID=UPI002608DF78|nr:aminotransferase class I/II-fold pyridoxal phosphate-dependent enzyme [Flavobacterium sp.]
MNYWKKVTAAERQLRIREALAENVNFSKDASLGYPASKLDGKVFYEEAPFLKEAPMLQSFVANPNHIGCHTFGTSEKAFKGTQEIEREVLNMIAVDIFHMEPENFDGYIAPGGTEANIQALWIYRNYFSNTFGAHPDEIAILASEDTHYSIPKGANLLLIDWLKVPVDFGNRSITAETLETILIKAKENGKKYFIVVANMGTTMFGSVDNPDLYTSLLEKHQLDYKLHVDAAYGGFVYPFSNASSVLDFQNPKISSITIDAHKMLQAPYGTGIFICRKGLIENVLTKEAEYVEGLDLTLCGSRSGANAVAVWLILTTYGAHGWFEKVSVLQMRTNWLCQQLDLLKIPYFREPFMNIVTVRASFVPEQVAERFNLVPQKHDATNQWYKIVVMDHVEIEHLTAFVTALQNVAITSETSV